MDPATLLVDQIVLMCLFELLTIPLSVLGTVTIDTPFVPIFRASGPFHNFYHCDF